MDSEIVITLAHTLSEIAAEKNIETMSEETILTAFQDALHSKSRDYETFLRRFNTLYEELHLNMKDISVFTHFDTSFTALNPEKERLPIFPPFAIVLQNILSMLIPPARIRKRLQA